MSTLRAATGLFLVGVLAAGWAGSVAAEEPVGHAGGGDPVVEIVRPRSGVTVVGSIPYGTVRVRAYDRDVGTNDGAGIRQVRVTIRDLATGKVVRRATERWRPYEFGFVLGKGRYLLTARAVSTRAAGATRSHSKIRIDVHPAGRALTAPKSVVRRQKAAAASLAALNQVRAAAGAGPVAADTAMSDFAYHWSREMARSGLRHSKSGYAENIAWFSDAGLRPSTAARVLNDMWRNSSGHYRNMTDRSHTRVGIGLFRRAGGWWGTHVFE